MRRRCGHRSRPAAANIAPLRKAFAHPLALAVAAVAASLLASAALMTHPGYTDAYYYFLAARRLASGEGLSVDFVWNFLEAPDLAALPVASHRFWMPLATALQAAGILAFGAWLDAFRAAQVATLLVALAIPAVTYLAARSFGATAATASLAALVAGLGGAYAPAWPSLDNFAPVAVLGTAFFASLATGRTLIAGLALGGLTLARADGLLYALALLPLARASPRAALPTLAIAAATALPWAARNALVGVPEGQLARAALLVRYEDFFRIGPPDAAAFLAAWPAVVAAKFEAMQVNATTFLLATFVLLGPLALLTAWQARHPAARGWLVVTLALYLAQSLVFTLHSTRGAFFHSAAGVVPTALALGLVGGATLLRPAARRAAAVALALGALALSAEANIDWHAAFDPPYAERRALAAAGLVRAPALAIDAAAWRYVLGGPVLVLPADGPNAARAVARRYGARTLVLERLHPSAYDALYGGQAKDEWLEPVVRDGGVVVLRVVSP